MKLPYDPVCPSVGRSVIISSFTSHALIGALVSLTSNILILIFFIRTCIDGPNPVVLGATAGLLQGEGGQQDYQVVEEVHQQVSVPGEPAALYDDH